MSDDMESVFDSKVHNANEDQDDDREFEEQDHKRIMQEVGIILFKNPQT